MSAINSNYKIGLYVRNSSVKQDTPEGTIKNQEERLRQYVKLRNMSGNFGEVVETYVDRSFSAKNMNRPAIQQLLQDIAKGKINMVAVSELSRITRNVRDFGEVWELLRKQECAFLSLRENVDTSNAAGEMVMYMLANIAQFERKQIGERVTANLRIRSERGLYNGGPIPLGYKRIPDRPGFLAIKEEDAEIVKAVFNYFLKFETLAKTAKELNKDGVKVPKYKEGGGFHRLGFFTVDVVRKILKRKAYIGVKEYFDGEKRTQVKAVWKPIIEEETFNRVQDILEKNHCRKKPIEMKTYPYILTGFTTCKTCGDLICGATAHGRFKKRYHYYVHGWASKKGSTLTASTFKCNPHRVPAEKLENMVLDNIQSLVDSPSMTHEIIEGARAIHAQDNDGREIRRLQSNISGYNGNLEALAERLGELPKSVSAMFIYKQMEKLEMAKKKATEQLETLKGHNQGYSRECPAEFENYRKFVGFIGQALEEEKDPEVKAKLLRRLIHKVEVGIDKIRIHYFAGQHNVGGADLNALPNFMVSGSHSHREWHGRVDSNH